MEVLVAILILAVTLPSLVRAYTLAADVASFARQRTEAAAIGQSALNRLLATGEWQTGTPAEEEQPGPTVYHWRTELADWEESGVQQLTVFVQWQHAGKDVEIRLDTLVYTPGAAMTSTVTAGGLP
jgi:hypothetical protein